MRLIDYPILYINLDKDKKRRVVLEKDLTKLNMDYSRIDAINGKNLHNKQYGLCFKIISSSFKTTPIHWIDVI